MLHLGNNLHIMQGMADASYDCIYADPPFNSNRLWRNAAGIGFDDRWTSPDAETVPDMPAKVQDTIALAGRVEGTAMANYLTHLAPRIIECRRLLTPRGNFVLHCDDKAEHWLRIIIVGVFGRNNFGNQLIWRRGSGHGMMTTRHCARGHDLILTACRRPATAFFNHEIHYRDGVEASHHHTHTDEIGVYRRLAPARHDAHAPTPGTPWTSWDGKKIYPCDYRKDTPCRWHLPDRDKLHPLAAARLPKSYDTDGKRDPIKRLDLLQAAGLLHWSPSGRMWLRMHHQGWSRTAPTTFLPVPGSLGGSKKRFHYPTEKPAELMHHLMQLYCPPPDHPDGPGRVLDPYCGSGATLHAADVLQVEADGIDQSPAAIRTCLRRAAGRLPLLPPSSNYDLAPGVDAMLRADECTAPDDPGAGNGAADGAAVVATD